MSALISSSAKRRALLLERARTMRHHPTPSEALLWHHIRASSLGVQFRRQQVIGDAIVAAADQDGLARKAALVVEIDGDAYHVGRVAADAARDRKLMQARYRVLRLPASLVQQEPLRAVEVVRAALG